MIYDSGCGDLFSMSIVYVALGVVVLIRSVSLIPTKTVPFDMPDDYVLYDHSVLSALRKRNTIDPLEKFCY